MVQTGCERVYYKKKDLKNKPQIDRWILIYAINLYS